MSDIALVDEELLVWPNGETVDVASIEGYADEARVLASALDDDNVIRTPDWVISELRAVSQQAARMVLVILNAEKLKRQASKALARAKANARVRYAALPDAQQTARIVLATVEEQDAYDVALAAFEYARRMGNLLSDYTGRVQTIGKQVELTYTGAGRRGGA
jgi:hypothetical protein